MDHPLIYMENSELRARVIQFLKSSYSVRRNGNIVLVCGGNCATHMRARFRDYCSTNHQDLEIFFPEFAMQSYFSEPASGPFDIADFEKMAGDLSHAIVIFPEAPGSFAETGYFSMVKGLASKTILALDSYWQGNDSFISMGPARKIAASSHFSAVIQISYQEPAFSDIIRRINRIDFTKSRKALVAESFGALSNYEMFCLIHECFNLLGVATFADVEYILRSLFKARIRTNTVRQLSSILIGAGYLQPVQGSEYGHYRTNGHKTNLLRVRDGHADARTQIRLDMTTMYISADDEFCRIQEAAAHAS